MTNVPDDVPLAPAPRTNWVAWALSVLFHPLLVPSFLFFLLVAVNPYRFGAVSIFDRDSMLIFLPLFASTFVLPVVTVLLMRALNLVGSFTLEERTDRIGPLLGVLVLYLWAWYNLSQSADVPKLFVSLMLGVVIALAAAFAINAINKISLHAVGMGGLVAGCIIVAAIHGGVLSVGSWGLGLSALVVLSVLLAGAVGSARLALGAHTQVQVYWGYAVGFLAQWVALKFYY